MPIPATILVHCKH